MEQENIIESIKRLCEIKTSKLISDCEDSGELIKRYFCKKFDIPEDLVTHFIDEDSGELVLRINETQLKKLSGKSEKIRRLITYLEKEC